MPMQHDFILVKLKEVDNKTSGGLFLPETAAHPFREGTVIKAGSGVYNAGTFIDIDIIEGDVVTFHASAGIKYKDGNHLIKYSDVIEVEQVAV